MYYGDTVNAEARENGENKLGSKKSPVTTARFVTKHLFVLSYLKQHMRVLTEEKSFVCTTCGKDFNDRSTLPQHTKKHS